MMFQGVRVQAGDVYRAQGMKGLGQEDGEYSIGTGDGSGYGGGGEDISVPLPSYSSEPIPVDLTGPGYGSGTGIDLQPTMAQLGGDEPSTLTDSMGNPVAQTSKPGTMSMESASQTLAASNSTLAALIASGASASQIAVARSNVANAQAAYNASARIAAGTTSTCSQTLVSGMCNTTLYMVGAVVGLFVMVGLMSGNPPSGGRR
jgi:hypothetical protein